MAGSQTTQKLLFYYRLPGTTLNKTVKRILLDRAKRAQQKKVKAKVAEIELQDKIKKHNPLPVNEQIAEEQRIKKDLQLRAQPKTKFQVDYKRKLTKEERDKMLKAKEFFPTVNERAIELRSLGFGWDLIENRILHQYTSKIKNKKDVLLKSSLIRDQLRALQHNETQHTPAVEHNTATQLNTNTSDQNKTTSTTTNNSNDSPALNGNQVRQYSTVTCSHSLARHTLRSHVTGLWRASQRVTRVTSASHVISTCRTQYSTRIGTESELVVTAAAAQKVLDLRAEEQNTQLRLRIQVDSGGCSGFEVKFLIEDQPPRADDVVFEKDGAQVLVDDISLPLLQGATIDYIDELARNCFAVVNNPNASKSCGCGVSFALKS